MSGSTTPPFRSLDDAFLDSPQIIVEVLSEQSRRIDQVEKKDAYLTLQSLTHYILLEQDLVRAVVYRRRGEGFEQTIFENLDDTIDLGPAGLKLTIRKAYKGALPERAE